MAHVLAYSRRHPRELMRYASLPGWVFYLNAISMVVGLTLLVLTMSSGIGFLLVFVDLAVFLFQFLVVGMPSFGKVLFAEQISPTERVVAFSMTVAAPGATALAVCAGLNGWGVGCC